MKYFCCDQRRRDAVRQHDTLNGLDYLEAGDNPPRLDLYFLKPLNLGNLQQQHIRIEGGERIRDVAVVTVDPPGSGSNVLVVTVNKTGDFSTYTLRLVPDADDPQALDGFDPLLRAVEFSFAITASELDAPRERVCPTAPLAEPEIDYLAKDYASFRQLLLDRMAVLLPQWRERNPADLGVALVELLAYAGDQLSYQQDAIATEAYLGTARRRVSARRHARLVDCFMHDGCNARVWVCLRAAAGVEGQVLKAVGPRGFRTRLLTRCPTDPVILDTLQEPVETRLQGILARYQPEVFELLHDLTLYNAHNGMKFHTWNDTRCCLPKGATQATLEGHYAGLRKGDVLLFEAEDADPSRRHAVRLTGVVADRRALIQDTLTALQLFGVPVSVLDTLAPLQDKFFDREEAFLQAVGAKLSPGWLDRELWQDGPGLYGQYFEYDEPDGTEPEFDPNNRKLGRLDPEIDFAWNRKRDPDLPPDRFAVRWQGTLHAQVTGEHTFYLTADDGVRFWLNDKSLIDSWGDQPPKQHTARPQQLNAGQQYNITLEYYQRGSGAMIQLEWEAPNLSREIIPRRYLSYGDKLGLLGKYYEYVEKPVVFENSTFWGTRQDLEIDFDWDNRPDPALRPDRFAVRWLGWLKAEVTGEHTFHITSDDGVRFRLNDGTWSTDWTTFPPTFANWTDHSPTTDQVAVDLEAGKSYAIQLEFYERYFEAVIKLEWEAPNLPREVIPSSQLRPPPERTLRALLLKYAGRTPITNPLPYIDPKTREEIIKKITEIEWAAEDALPFPLCIDQGTGESPSVARGNVVLADHGHTVVEPLEPMPPDRWRLASPAGDRCQPPPMVRLPARFRPLLPHAPLTQTGTVTKTVTVGNQRRQQVLAFDPEQSATTAQRWEMSAVLPAIRLTDSKGQNWLPCRDLLGSEAESRNEYDTEPNTKSNLDDPNKHKRKFVVEVEADGGAWLRFGNPPHGSRPEEGTEFAATYRVGNGVRGNIGAESLGHIASSDPALAGVVVGVRNPLPARGGVDPEDFEDVRQRAPVAFRTQERGVTPDDYAAIVRRHPEVQRAAATFRWTGSWRTVFVVVERVGGLPVDAAFAAELRRFLEPYRLVGYDLRVDSPRYVSLEIGMKVRIKPDYFRSDVYQALREVFSNRTLSDGRRGVFHPANFDFGQPVYLSPLYAAAQAVAGVGSVEVVTFQRQDVADRRALDEGKLLLNRLEIARLDNNPNFPQHGVLRLELEGGK